MKQLLLLVCLLPTLAAHASTEPRRRGWDAAVEPAAPAVDSVQLRAAHYTHFLADALRLSNRQVLAVRRCAYEQVGSAEPARAWQQFDHVLLRILTPGQYSTLGRLTETLPR